MGEETTIMGTVLSVVFQNEENGYAVLRLVTDDGELLTLVGCVPCAAPGENLTATGSFSSHPQYGEQFSASEVERYLPSNETEILNYLASGVVRGVGPATAEKLVARFGIETLQVLESEPEKLTAIKGMTAHRAQEISAAFRLGEDILAGLNRLTGLRNRGMKVRPGLYVLRRTAMPAVLVELGFITNPSDAQLMDSRPGLFADGIYAGILEYLGL